MSRVPDHPLKVVPLPIMLCHSFFVFLLFCSGSLRVLLSVLIFFCMSVGLHGSVLFRLRLCVSTSLALGVCLQVSTCVYVCVCTCTVVETTCPLVFFRRRVLGGSRLEFEREHPYGPNLCRFERRTYHVSGYTPSSVRDYVRLSRPLHTHLLSFYRR